MNGFDPGEGWREVDEQPTGGRYLMEMTDEGWRYWVPAAPVPPLPTAPYTVIRVTSSPEPTLIGQALMLDLEDDRYPWRNAEDAWPLDYITGFEVLAEPRAVTAKAVLDRLTELLAPNSVVTSGIYRTLTDEFGADQ